MTALVEFETSKFDLLSESENEYNQIYGQSILLWIVDKCPDVSFKGSPDTEDWGWFIDAIWEERRYVIGASAEYGDSNLAWCVVQIEKKRSLKEKFFGKEKLVDSDGLVRKISSLFLNNPEFDKVEYRLENN